MTIKAQSQARFTVYHGSLRSQNLLLMTSSRISNKGSAATVGSS
jgi:hypothetical protein